MQNIMFNDDNNLIPALIQEEKSKEILMLGYMNKEALTKTRKTGWVYLWSRSRKKLWHKGETSGNKLLVKKIYIDCDQDSLLIIVNLIGNATCHTGNKSCFYDKLV